jgi:hypothetical protein
MLEVNVSLEINCLYRDNRGNWILAQEGSRVAHRHSTVVIQEQKLGIWSRTAEFGKRFFAGSLGSAIPLAVAVAYQYATKSSFHTEFNQRAELALFTTALGLASAAVTSTPSNAFNRGIMFGSVAQVTSAVGGIGHGKSWDATVAGAQALKAGVVAIPAGISTRYAKISTWISDTSKDLSTRCSQAWTTFWKTSAKDSKTAA